MQQKQIRRCEPALRQLIKVEIAGSGLKASDGFSKALDGYASHYRLKGKKAEIVKAYLAKTAISIAKHDKGIFSSGIKAKLVQPDDVKAAVFFYHLPEFPDDDCSGASRQIMHLEQARPKGTMGQLTPAMSKYLDKLLKKRRLLESLLHENRTSLPAAPRRASRQESARIPPQHRRVGRRQANRTSAGWNSPGT